MLLETQNDHRLQSKNFYISFTTKIALGHEPGTNSPSSAIVCYWSAGAQKMNIK